MQTSDPAKLARVAIMTYSFDRIVKSPGHEQEPGRTLELSIEAGGGQGTDPCDNVQKIYDALLPLI